MSTYIAISLIIGALCSLLFIDVVILVFLNPEDIGIKVEIDTFETADYLGQI